MSEMKQLFAGMGCKGNRTVLFDKGTTVCNHPFHEMICAYETNGADGVYLCELSANKDEHEQMLEELRRTAALCKFPLIVGGYIRSFQDVCDYMDAGASIVWFDSADPFQLDLMEEAASKYGNERVYAKLASVQQLRRAEEFLSYGASRIILDVGNNTEIVDSDQYMRAEVPFMLICADDTLHVLSPCMAAERVTGVILTRPQQGEHGYLVLKQELRRRGQPVWIPDGWEQKEVEEDTWMDYEMEENSFATGVVDKFLTYVAFDTQSAQDQEQVPSTDGQRVLAQFLHDELEDLGASKVRISEYGYVYAEIPANTDRPIPALGFIAHMDTAPDYSGTNVKPQIVHDYHGDDIILDIERGDTMGPDEFPELLDYIGQDLITTDGTTLLGADDKAGVAEIMSMAEYILTHPEIEHGKICIGFTPDEEVGRGADFFDVEGFGAEVAYTLDGGAIGEIEYENFNAASAKITIQGVSIHPGSAKGRMKNSLLIGMELNAMLPVFEIPAYTEGYEGFFHLSSIEGGVDRTTMKYIIRDHDREKFEAKKNELEKIAAFLNQRYGEGTITLEIKDSYYNMSEKIEPHQYLITLAEDCMKEIGIEPKIIPIRGGTDGARLSFMGLPCPNLCTGGHNYHGRHEYICIQSMEKTVELIIRMVEAFAKRSFE